MLYDLHEKPNQQQLRQIPTEYEISLNSVH